VVQKTTEGNRMPKFKKGESGNPKGRPPGAPNKTTVAVRESLEIALKGEIEKIPGLLRELDAKDRLEAISRLLPYISPKLQAAYLRDDTGPAVIRVVYENPRDV
jgi:hypothetical protein